MAPLTFRPVQRKYGDAVEGPGKIRNLIGKKSLALSERISVRKQDELYFIRVVHVVFLLERSKFYVVVYPLLVNRICKGFDELVLTFAHLSLAGGYDCPEV